MVECVRFVNSWFTANTYLLSHPDYDNVWLVDPGETEPVFTWMKEHNKSIVSGILLTHTHFDHIFGTNEIIKLFPNCPIYVANEVGREALYNPKKNNSFYTERGAIVVSEKAEIKFFEPSMNLWSDVEMESFCTPGHSEDSICFAIENLLFTGDTLIKDIRTVTKLKGGSVNKLKESLQLISSYQNKQYIVYPGHNETFVLDGYDLKKAL